MAALPQKLAPSTIGSTSRMSLRMMKAARLIAEEQLSQGDIAARIGVSQYAISRWKRNFPGFLETVERYRALLAQSVLDAGIAQKHNRIKAADRRWKELNGLIADRADDGANNPEFTGVPGAKRGLLVMQQKCIGGGKDGKFINEFVVDHDTLKEIRALEEYAAKEMGQFEPDKATKADQHAHVHIHYPTLTDGENAMAVAAQEADMPPAARRLLTRPSDGKPLDR